MNFSQFHKIGHCGGKNDHWFMCLVCKQAQICAEGCEGENFTHIDTEKELI